MAHIGDGIGPAMIVLESVVDQFIDEVELLPPYLRIVLRQLQPTTPHRHTKKSVNGCKCDPSVGYGRIIHYFVNVVRWIMER